MSAENKGAQALTTHLPPGLGSRGAEILGMGSDASVAPPWHLRGLDNNVIFKFRKFVTERKKELSGTVQKQTQAEQGYHFAGKKTDCVSVSKSIQAIKGLWHRASGIVLFVRSLE